MKFYYGSGSPFAWYVWLVLEHKNLNYELNLRSLQNGELKKPEYLAINPHGKVPTLIDGDLTLWEATAIVEYLEERYPQNSLLPKDIAERAIARRLVAEGYSYLYPALRRLMELTLLRTEGDGELAEILTTLNCIGSELTYFENILNSDYFAGNISIADFAIYPLLALFRRFHQRRPQLGPSERIWPKLNRLMQRIEQLPYFTKTYPPHWKG
ncbi:MAG: glutathione S-transferase family protein [Methylotenera sp.]|uniref:glutathione S-transferase family protein n=1 Tax=Methylotenera sp. TaxID=2051956 RepID=UPI00180FCC2B|nr:glutathione S-transferase family protein [Methylotenera sp.]NOU24396.1 glutathione S-transferase family protein [Methylotenera sp.]